MLKDYESLASLSKSLPGNHPLLETISVFFSNSGIADDELLDKNVRLFSNCMCWIVN